MISAWLQKHRISLLSLLACLTLAGIFAAFKLPVALFPNISFPRIAIVVDSGDRPVDKMIIEVTKPLEQVLRSEPGVLNIRSTSTRGAAEISVNFAWGTNMVSALLQVQSAISQVIPNLPAGTVFKAQRMDPTVFPIFGLALTSENKNLVELRDFSYFHLLPLLSAISGVSRVEILGGEQAEFQILIDPEKLRINQLTLSDVAKSLAVNNVVNAVGRIEDYYRLYLILSDTRLETLEDIKKTILRSGRNGIVKVEDVGQVVAGVVPQWTRVTANGHDAVLINIIQQVGANTVEITKNIKEKLHAFESNIPKSILIKPYYDQSKLVVNSAASVRDAIISGAILAAIILILFLRNIRMTVIVAMILPCVIATTVLFLSFFNMGFNIMTLGGIAAAVGLIIDDSVVMLEYIMRRLSERNESDSMHKTILSASMQMLKPLAGSSLATVIIFVPLAFIEGVTGGFFKALAFTMVVGLSVSFFYAFLVIPLLGEKLLKLADAKNLEKQDKFLNTLHQHYQKTMGALFQKPQHIAVVIIALITISYFSYKQVGSGFMPHMDEGGFILDYIAEPGTSLDETDRLLRQVEKIIIAIPEVDSYSRRTGLQLGGGLTEPNIGDFFIHLKDKPRRDISNIMDDLRNQIEHNVPGLQVETAQLMEDLIGDLTAVPQPIEIKIFSNNQNDLIKTANQAADILHQIPGVVEIKNGIIISGDSVNIQVDRTKAALFRLDPDVITQQINMQLKGNVASQALVGEKLIGIRVVMPENLRDRVKQLQSLPLRTADGHYISLRSVANITIQQGQTQITRENLKPMLAVKARIEGRDLGSTMRDVKSAMKKLPLPAGAYIEYGGLYQEQQKSFYDLLIVFISALLLVSVLLLFLYENLNILFSIIIIMALSLSGVFFGLFVTGTELNISSMMGMTMIIGIVTEIAIFYFSELNTYANHGIKELIASGLMRMRPILMTTIIAILALMPLALGIGTGSSMQQPLAVAIISGLVFAMPLVLLIMPVVYYLILSISINVRHRRTNHLE